MELDGDGMGVPVRVNENHPRGSMQNGGKLIEVIRRQRLRHAVVHPPHQQLAVLRQVLRPHRLPAGVPGVEQ